MLQGPEDRCSPPQTTALTIAAAVITIAKILDRINMLESLQ
jgi:hypothetical protein